MYKRQKRYLAINGTRSPDDFHRALGKIVWDKIGMERDAAGLTEAISEIRALRGEYERDLRILGTGDTLNDSLEKAFRVADFFELAELMARDALHREESCGGHFRAEHQTADGEAERDDEHFSYVAAWEWKGPDTAQQLHKEQLTFENIHLATRSYA